MRGLESAATWSCCLHITILFLMWACCYRAAGTQDMLSFEMRMIYKYSDEFRQHMEHVASDWPRHSTADFHRDLANHDRQRHATSRNLLSADVYSLSPSNETLFAEAMGGLHYSFIELGTPSKLFFVALDTGSDLLWVPCDCQQCSDQNWAKYDVNVPNLKFAVYSPANSTTSKPVACTDAACTSTLDPNTCDVNANRSCSYAARYLSANTSSSGPVVQDVVVLTSETSGSKVTSEIYLGCGQRQTGDFLHGGAPNGLFGLGPEVYSVPSTFARNGITKNVFSMCFSNKDDSGRLVFGRKAGASLPSTPIVPFTPNVFYVLGVQGFVAAGVKINVTYRVVFDTGTSYTILPSNVVKPIGDALSAAVALEPFSFNLDTASFNYCWNITTNAELDRLSSLSIVFSGGGLWTISAPLLGVDDRSNNLLFVCLGILSSPDNSTTPIIGFNFMGDYEYFFDRETSAFSWSPSNCSGDNGTSTLAPSTAPEPGLTPVQLAPTPAPAKAATPPKSSPQPQQSTPPVSNTTRPPPPPTTPPPPPNSSPSLASSLALPLVFLILLFS